MNQDMDEINTYPAENFRMLAKYHSQMEIRSSKIEENLVDTIFHQNECDMANFKAANQIWQRAHLQPDKLDLHDFRENEAVECFDIFIDTHISTLRSMGKSLRYVFVVTGRGLHSANGVPKIKVKVKDRCKKRELQYKEDPENPGMLRIWIFKDSTYTTSL